MSARNKADPDPSWDHHEAIIKSLYVEGKANLRDLIVIMAESYGFKKTKSQYESQFKIWGIRKYRRKDEWKSIGRNIAERKRAGKESIVYMNGDPISRSKLQKQIKRYAFTTALERSRLAPIPPIPNGFEIRTPAAEEIVPLPTFPGNTPSLPIGTETQICPSAQLQNVSSTLLSQTVTSNTSLPGFWNTMAVSPPVMPTNLSPIQSHNAIYPTLDSAGMYESFGFIFEDVDESFRPLKLVSNLPFCELEDGLFAQIEPSLISTNARVFGSELTLETILLPGNQNTASHEDIDGRHEVLNSSQALTGMLRALLPSSASFSQAEDQIILSPTHQRSDSVSCTIFTLLLFAMANNYAGLNSFPIDQIVEYLKRQPSIRLLHYVLRRPGPESEAFAEKLFQAAILIEDTRTVDVLLQGGLSPNDLVCVHYKDKYTPLEYSSMKQNIEITRLLLDAKVDVNRSITGEEGSRGAIACAIGGHRWRRVFSDDNILVELVQILFEAGCNFSWQEVDCRIMENSQKTLDLLVDHSLKTKTYEQAWYYFVKNMGHCSNTTATRTYTKFLKAGVIIDHSLRFLFNYRFYFPIDLAAERGNLELVQLLLRSGVSVTRKTLSFAIKGRNKELIRVLLDCGADLFAFEESATEHRYNSVNVPSPVRSPLSEAIRWGDTEILDLLEENGAWSRIVNKVTLNGEFEDVLIAASVRGELTTVQNLLNYRPPNFDGKDLTDALVAAIYLNKDEIALTLLDAGANVNGGMYKDSDMDAGTNEDFYAHSHRGPALVEALLQKKEKLVRLILDADVDFDRSSKSARNRSSKTPLTAALEWGDPSIIREVISMGVCHESEALKLSVKQRDLECTQLLVNAGVQISPNALKIAVVNNDIEMVEYLFSVGAQAADSDALYEAEALPNGLPMVERLLAEFARRYPHGSVGYGISTFRRAIIKGDLALIKLLLEAKIIFKIENQTPRLQRGTLSQDYRSQPREATLLGDAIMQRHTTSLAIIQSLLNEFGNPNIVVQNSRGKLYHVRETALLAAIDTKEIQKVQLFIDAGANVNWPATKGVKRTPLQKSAEVGSHEITQLLIDKGGLVNSEPAVRGGATALQLAAIGGYIGIAVLLLEKGANVNAPAAKFYGRTALEGAAEHGRIDMLKLLYNAGAKFQGTEYETARELAKKNGHMATWRYLESLYGQPK